MNDSILEFLLKRRSSSVSGGLLGDPGPRPDELERILTAASRVPDHKKLAPWRFIVVEGEARARLGAKLAEVLLAEEKEAPSPARIELEATRFVRAPTVVIVVSRLTRNPAAPEWEQILSAGAACQNLTLAANALGYGTNWITEWYSYSPGFGRALGLGANERVAGVIYIGTAKQTLPDRDRPKLETIMSRWN
jgi:nitroreductase